MKNALFEKEVQSIIKGQNTNWMMMMMMIIIQWL